MRQALAFISTFVLLIFTVLFVLLLVKPNLGLNKHILKVLIRKKLAIYYFGIVTALFIFIGLIKSLNAPNKQNASINTPPQIQEDAIKLKEDKELNKQNKQLSELYKVTKVIDGDTIEVNIAGKIERLRLIGINTPETLDPRKPLQCFGKESSNNAKELLEGKKVRLESDASQYNRDKYGRLLRYVYFEDGTSYNKLIISEGYAHEYTYNTPYKYQSEYKQAQKDAEKSQRGLWSTNTCAGDTEKSAQTTILPPQTSKPNTQQAQGNSNCDPNYSPCIPKVSYDLDCGDISTSVQVIGTDRHRFDRDGDGYGCESN